MHKEFHIKKKKSHRGTILLLGLAVLVFVTAVKYIPNKLSKKDEIPQTQEAAAVNPTEEIHLKKEAAIKIKTVYNCGHIKTKTSEADENLIGKTRKEIEKIHPDWKIEEFSENLLSAEISVDSPCENHYLIKLKDGTLFVYKKNKQNEPVREQKVSTSMLTSDEIKELESGISAETEFEVLEILESFAQ